MLLKEERQRHILDLLRREGKVLATEIGRRLKVSEDTIRRDLQELDTQGRIMRVHGGALSRLPQNVPYAERRIRQVEAKSAIGRLAATLVKPGQVVFMDGGTTILQVARAIPRDMRLTVITNSLPLALELTDRAAFDIVMLGGRLLKESQIAAAAETVAQVRQFRADLLFLGTCAIDSRHGITVPDFDEAPVKRAMIDCATVAVAVATADKVNTVAPYLVAPVERLGYLVTDASPEDKAIRKFRKLGVSVLTSNA